MDHAQVLALIASLSGTPSPDPFATLRAASLQPNAIVSIQPCPRLLPLNEIEGATIICGTVRVPEERSKIGGRKLPLNFAVLRASTRYPEPDPVVYLEGGPGGSAMTMLPTLEMAFRPWRSRRDIVIYDQRSAGISGASVNCFQALSANVVDLVKAGGGIPSAEQIRRCTDELGAKGIPLAAYNTTQNALDLPVIMSALGYRDYNIYGISYGTKLALEVMRVAPQNIRSVIIDGVAPSWIQLYNSFAMKHDEAIQHVVDQCAADRVCNEAYPELGRIFVEALNKAAKGEITFRGEKVPVEFVLMPVITRNGKYGSAPITRFIPAYVYELWRGREMPTVEKVFDMKFDMPKPGDAELTAAAAKLDAGQKALVQQLLDSAAIEARARRNAARAVEGLRESQESEKRFGPLTRLFDAELATAMVESLRGDKERVKVVLADYASMQSAVPSRERLQAFVNTHFAGATKDRLLALLAGMNAREIEGSFAIIRRDTYTALGSFLFGFYLDVYACQEDIPFNSMDGYKSLTAKLKYPQLAGISDRTAKAFFEGCGPIKPQPRDNWHVPVKSDIPTLSFGSLFDVQTPASWARIAIEQLTNAQAFMIPEAGHGALLYQPCVGEMGVAFIDNPKRRFDNSCSENVKVEWHIAPWVAGQKK
ncbi:alpha/beta hydrolase [Rhabdaerophilum sp. SD176]|uniref:alpha/beta hydrolase n=1 Tax=Rhabdaerophilum sp. SD176 TaxID=2983548 RepID=UPI0024DFF292|nr:alpha/beta hydrolase [Rhabdaerophilum sp. SD176]